MGRRLVKCEHFFVDRRGLDMDMDLDPGRTWRGLLVLEGAAVMGEIEIRAGDTALLPGAAGPRRLVPRPACRLLLYGAGPG
jgi:hypothetical protein